jgi:nucleoside-diphosphate-sugar epimerase
MAVYAAGLQPPARRLGIVTEDSPVLPDDEYGLSKWLGEELARYHARRHQLPTVALRLGMFPPETFERYGFRLLFGGVDDATWPKRSCWPRSMSLPVGSRRSR